MSSASLTPSSIAPNFSPKSEIAFSWPDYGLFCAMLGLSALIGIYFGCFGSKQSTTKEYLLGGKTMHVLPVVLSLVSSHVSGITLLGVPADVYTGGAAYWLLAPGMLLTAAVMMFVYLPVFMNLDIKSAYEYLEMRFDRSIRMLASSLFAISLFFYLPIVIYIPALALSAATGIHVHLVTPIVCGVCIFYTTIGGLKAVVWTDALQFTVTLIAVFVVFFLGINSLGGFGEVWWKAVEGHRLDSIVDFNINPFKKDSFWIIIIGSSFHWLALSASNQGCVQKFLSLATLKQAKSTVWLYAFGIALLKTLSILTGLIIYAKYADCDPFKTGQISRRDQLLPYYVMDVAGGLPGLPGLFISGIVSSALSTLSVHLNCLAGTVYEDFISRFMPKGTTEKTASNILKIVVVIIGVICTALVFVVEKLGGVFQLSVAFTSVSSGPVLGLFTLGMLFPKVNAKGALWAAICAEVLLFSLILTTQYYKFIGGIHYQDLPTSIEGCVSTLNITSQMTTPLPTVGNVNEPFILFKLSSYLYTVVGTFITIILAVIISFFTRDNNAAPVRRELLSPLVHSLVPDDKTSIEVKYNTVGNALKIVSDYEVEKESNIHS